MSWTTGRPTGSSRPRSPLTARFVESVTQGVPAGDTLDALLVGGGKLLSIDVNEFTSEDVAHVLERHGLRGTVVYGGVTEVRGRQLGMLIIESTSHAHALCCLPNLPRPTGSKPGPPGRRPRRTTWRERRVIAAILPAGEWARSPPSFSRRCRRRSTWTS